MVGLVETMRYRSSLVRRICTSFRRTSADGPQLAAYSFRPKDKDVTLGLLAVSRKPMARSDALVYELYGLTEDKIRIVGNDSQNNMGSVPDFRGFPDFLPDFLP
jgi:hypothetical protein